MSEEPWGWATYSTTNVAHLFEPVGMRSLCGAVRPTRRLWRYCMVLVGSRLCARCRALEAGSGPAWVAVWTLATTLDRAATIAAMDALLDEFGEDLRLGDDEPRKIVALNALKQLEDTMRARYAAIAGEVEGGVGPRDRGRRSGVSAPP